MIRSAFRIDVAPLLPEWLLLAAAILALLLIGFMLYRRAAGTGYRLAALAMCLLALINPRWVSEVREERPDIALVVIDQSDSTRLVANRAQSIAAARQLLMRRLEGLDRLETRVVEVPEQGQQGTRLLQAVERALAEIPRARLAGIVAITDGQVHDVAEHAAALSAPFHVLLPGASGEVDRRLRLVEGPSFGIIGRNVDLRVMAEDLGVAGASGNARMTVRIDGGAPRTETVPIGREYSFSVPIERGGPMVVEAVLEERPGEVSAENNRLLMTINGIRDRLRVLLVSGEPHAGERTWRRLLKSDPGVDLVHFTILRPPEKDDLTPLNELALIAFPVRELFQVKLREFDLIIFDRFSNRGILPPAYLRNIAEYVRAGGALLVSVGPEFMGGTSLANTPLGPVLPARPLAGGQALLEEPYRPQISDIGRRHPVTSDLLAGATPSWGRWYRLLRSTQTSGNAVMQAPNGAPLLILDRVGEGRVALMLSDHIWLWARGHDGGGPHQELLRRLAHWLMREPQLEEEELRARYAQGALQLEHRTLQVPGPREFEVTAPDGAVTRLPAQDDGRGRSVAELPASASGVWRVAAGQRTTLVAVPPGNPPEYQDLRASPEPLRLAMAETGGSFRWLGDGSQVPELRRVAAGRAMAASSAAGWIGLRRNEDHLVTEVRATSLMPPWLALALIVGFTMLAWRREGR
ncbi:hypothetical protein EOD42_03225 [Rhodovarius crocodyli]|uniref:Glutamine amidotransferase domain-containing protein n=1 Tax=Rhodovarius crocodyli TaxID=1979269 RepID=A0A437MNA8_9PROT|nr:hypothetical protein [Rhodovarius crocodyli]RVT99133.1 hypothetical protein EOD42_03225 [Rhodovarius crocodyli]